MSIGAALRGTILLVEDEAVLRMVLADHLADLGYETIEAGDAGDALDVLGSGAALALMITDVDLPGMDGRALSTEARRLRPGLGILFSTGDVASVHAWPGFDPASMSTVGKPFTLEELAVAVGALAVPPGR